MIEADARWYELYDPDMWMDQSWHLVSDQPWGNYAEISSEFLVGDGHGSLYSGKIILLPDGQPALMAFNNLDADGRFGGTITDPMPITILTDGRLKLEGG